MSCKGPFQPQTFSDSMIEKDLVFMNVVGQKKSFGDTEGGTGCTRGIQHLCTGAGGS